MSLLAGLKRDRATNCTDFAIQIRWMLRRDLAKVIEIEQALFTDPWCEDDFRQRLRQNECIGVVAEANGAIVGYMLYDMHPERLELLSLAVHPHRHGVGTALMGYIKFKMTSHTKRHSVECCVPDSNLNFQLFLKSQGFMCVGVWPKHFDADHDAYRFLFHRNWIGADHG